MLKKELEKLGFTEKESSVYLAAVELGPSSVQKIANKAKVKRATTYVMIEELIERGLMSTFIEGKKTIYLAEKPDRVLDYLKNQKEEIEKKISDFQDILPEIKSFFNSSENKPKVKYYEGVEGLKAVQDDFSCNLKKGDEVFAFIPLDDFRNSVLNEKLKSIRSERIENNINFKAICTSRAGNIESYKNCKNKLTEYRFVPFEKYPFRGGMNIYDNKIFMIDYLGKTGGIMIENRVLADLMKMIFMICWTSASVTK